MKLTTCKNVTCSYFAGIDIEDRCHLISISTHNQPYTLLSTGRLAQIAGRCRNGLLSEHIIYDTKPLESATTEEEYKEKQLVKAGKIAEVLNNLTVLAREDEDIAEFEQFAESFFIFKAKAKVAETYSTAIVRKNIEERYVPAFFNIDAIVEKFNLHHELYYERDALFNALRDDNKVKLELQHIPKEDHNTEVLDSIKEGNKERLAENLQKAKQDVIEWIEDGGKYWHDFERIKIAEIKDKEVELFYKRVGKFFGHIDSEFLLDKLIENHETKAFTKFNNSLAFWLLEDTHPLKAHVLAVFDFHTLATMRRAKPGIRVLPDVRDAKMAEILKSQLHQRKISDQWAAELFSCFFNAPRIGGKYYKIVGLNPNRFPDPIATMKEGVNLYNLFVLPYA